MTTILSIVVCTHNRYKFLENILADLSLSLDDNSASWEVLIIDNASTDSTKETVDRFTSQFPNFSYFYEPQVGLSYARNRGWQEAKGEYVAYLDDDCRIPLDWIPKALKIID